MGRRVLAGCPQQAAQGGDLAAWLTKWQTIYPKLCGWVEEHIEETLTYDRPLRQRHQHLKSTDEIDKSFVRDGGMLVGLRLRAPLGCLIR